MRYVVIALFLMLIGLGLSAWLADPGQAPDPDAGDSYDAPDPPAEERSADAPIAAPPAADAPDSGGADAPPAVPSGVLAARSEPAASGDRLVDAIFVVLDHMMTAGKGEGDRASFEATLRHGLEQGGYEITPAYEVAVAESVGEILIDIAEFRPGEWELETLEGAQRVQTILLARDYAQDLRDRADPLIDGMYEIVVGLVLSGKTADDKDEFFEILSTVFEKDGEKVRPTLEMAISDELDKIIAAAARHTPAQTATAGEEARHQAMVALARDHGRALRSRWRPGGTASKGHEGQRLIGQSINDLDTRAGYGKVTWKTIGGFAYEKGMTLPAEVQALDDRKVVMTGFMMASGRYENIKEFLLVQSRWSCCFGVPPDVNQVVVVRIPEDQMGIDLISRAVLVYGVLDAGEEAEDGFVTSVYRILADDVVEVD